MDISKLPSPKAFSPIKQAYIVCSMYKNFTFQLTGRESVKINGRLQASELQPIYEIEITYTLGKFPKVKILSPAIKDDAPHTFKDNSICTFYPDTKIWNRKMKISDTLIPWICDWIFQYEIWLITGKWNGTSDPRHPRGNQNVN